MNTRKKNIRLVLAVLFVLSVQLFAVAPKNVIFCIGDGMGFEQVKAAGIYLDGEKGSLFFETFPCSGEVTTYSADKAITDSGADMIMVGPDQPSNFSLTCVISLMVSSS